MKLKRISPWIYVILACICAGVFGVLLFEAKSNRERSWPNTEQAESGSSATVNRNHGFDRRTSYLEYTKHARCRMECRKISENEVKDIMLAGKINYVKSDVKAKPCPAYAVEGMTHDRQRVRIVFGQCDQKTKVITCIDLDTDWECHCPGDDDKYKNRN